MIWRETSRASGSSSYAYDALDRLVHAEIPNATTTYFLGYSYDAFGNMQQQTKSWWVGEPLNTQTRGYTVDWRTNRMITQKSANASLTYGYDESGNVISSGSRGFVFDEDNRLREVSDARLGPLGRYDYDASGYRVRSEIDGNETFY